ncbi:MAG: CoA transferase, partial [Tepidiformaceae bacterium]
DEAPYRELCSNLNLGTLTQLARDPARAATLAPGLGHINTLLAEFFASISSAEAYEEGQRRLLLHGIVSTPKDLAENTQLRAREWFAQLEFDYLDALLEFPGAPYRLSETPVRISRPPRLGEHTDEVLASLAPAGRAL